MNPIIAKINRYTPTSIYFSVLVSIEKLVDHCPSSCPFCYEIFMFTIQETMGSLVIPFISYFPWKSLKGLLIIFCSGINAFLVLLRQLHKKITFKDTSVTFLKDVNHKGRPESTQLITFVEIIHR